MAITIAMRERILREHPRMDILRQEIARLRVIQQDAANALKHEGMGRETHITRLNDADARLIRANAEMAELACKMLDNAS